MNRFLLGLIGLLAITPAEAQVPYWPLQAKASGPINTSSSGLAQVVAAIPFKRVYLVNYAIMSAGTTTFQWSAGTGTNCGTNTTALSGLFALTSTNPGLAIGSIGAQLVTPPGYALCINLGSAVSVQGHFAYDQF